MNREINKTLNVIATMLLADGYNYRTMKAVAEEAGVPIADLRAAAVNAGFETCKTRRSDGASLIGFGGNSRDDVAVLKAISGALLDPQYTLRSAKAIAEAVEADSYDAVEYIIDVADSFGYNTGKTRRRDGAALIGLGQ